MSIFTTLNFNILFEWMLSFFLLISSVNSSAQQRLTEENFIKGCATYRASLIHQVVDVMVDFNHLVDSLKVTTENPEGHELFRELFMKGILSEPFYNVRELIKGIYPHEYIRERSAYRAYLGWGDRNRFSLFDINVLSYNNIIEQKQPFKLTNLKLFWEEVSFYNIQSNHTIFDIGAGNGFLSFILAMSGVPLNIYMTEIAEDYFPYLTRHIELFNKSEEPAKILFRKGEEKALGIPSVKADRIILRDSYHHFKFQEEMLASIRDRLKDDGYLIVMEATTDLKDGKFRLCKEATTHEKILDKLSENGFDLVEKKIVDSSYLMKFKKSQ